MQEGSFHFILGAYGQLASTCLSGVTQGSNESYVIAIMCLFGEWDLVCLYFLLFPFASSTVSKANGKKKVAIDDTDAQRW